MDIGLTIPAKFFRVYAELSGRDLIAEVSAECRRAGVHLYCYTGYGHAFMTVGWVDQHPQYADWVIRDPEGKPHGTYGYHIGWHNWQKLCRVSDAYRAAIRQIVREYCEHDIDGVYFDAPSAHFYGGVCLCSSCRINYSKATGLPIERLKSPDDREALAAWYTWANECTSQDLLEFRSMIHKSGKFMMFHNAHTWQPRALRAQYQILDGFMIEHSVETHSRLLHGFMGAAMARNRRQLSQMYLGSYCVSNFGQPKNFGPWTVHQTTLRTAMKFGWRALPVWRAEVVRCMQP